MPGESDPTAAQGWSHERGSDQSRVDKRPRPSSRESPDLEPTSVPSSSRSRPTLNQTPSLRGSSRDTNDMHRSTTPPEASSSGTIKYTRTGRVSKATKGQRVHHCEECGKTYTRAEHLRRHQQNHKPGAFPCDIPGCGRSFYREDLLARHKARHNDPNDPPSRRQSVTSAHEAGGLFQPEHLGSARPAPATTSSLSAVAPGLQAADTLDAVDSQQPDAPSRAPKRVQIPPNELCPGIMPLAVGGPLTESYNMWQPASPQTPPCYDYDEPSGPYFQLQSVRPRQFCGAAFSTYQQPQRSSRSPEYAGSSNLNSQWLYPTSFCTPCDCGSSSTFTPSNHSDMVAIPCGSTRPLSAEAIDVIELQDLANVFQSIAVDDCLDGSCFSRESSYVEAYWAGIHDSFPVLHRPTFQPISASPLLRAAVVALGAQCLGGREDLMTAKDLHERCLKILKKRAAQDIHTYRACDMQAVLLVEIYSLFRSRRPPLQLSKSFELVYRHICNDPQALNLDSHQAMALSFDQQGSYTTLERHTKQRILLSCYTVEQQHALLFGRQTLDCFAMSPLNLPFPMAQSEWEGYDVDGTAHVHPFERLYEALQSLPFMAASQASSFDCFASTLMLHCLLDSSDTYDQLRMSWHEAGNEQIAALVAAARSPRARLTYSTLMLCKHTPVRALLAVAGESWVMAEKMGGQEEYTEAQLNVAQWAKGMSQSGDSCEFSVTKAVGHALEILQIHHQHPRSGVIFQEWALYLAAVTIWAYAHITKRQHGPLIGPNPLESAELSGHELELIVSATFHSGNEAVLTWTEAFCVLSWVKCKLERADIVPHNNGLRSGALDVLGKLISGGNEEGRWF